MLDIALSMNNVCRVLPRDTSHLHVALLREMLLPISLLNTDESRYFYGLKNINIDIFKGENIGVIGTHQSGKTLLANLASGLLLPTSGNITFSGKRLLVSKPTAGFKPSLTIEENLGFRASLMGIYGKAFDETLSRTLDECELPDTIISQPLGNISPYIAKQLAFSMLMQIETDIIVIDEIMHAGTSGMRDASAKQLKNRISNCTSLIISGNPAALDDIADRIYVLDKGDLSGPYEIKDALQVFNSLSGNHPSIKFLDKITESNSKDIGHEPQSNSDDFSHNTISDFRLEESKEIKYEEKVIQRLNKFSNKQKKEKSTKSKKSKKLFTLISLNVDDDPEYSHRRYALLKEPGDLVHIVMVIESNKDSSLHGASIHLVESSSKAIVCEAILNEFPSHITKGNQYILNFSFNVPHELEGVFGMAFLPINAENNIMLKSQLKLLIMAVGDTSNRHINEFTLLNTNFNAWNDNEV